MVVKSVGQVGLPQINLNTLGYQGSPLPYVPIVVASRAPTGTDINYVAGCEWSNGINLDIWKLYGFNDGVADWRMLASGGGGGGILTLSDDDSVKTFPDITGNVAQLGSAGIHTTAGTSSITWALVGDGVATQYYNVDAATGPGVNPVVPDGSGVLNVTGGQVASLDVGVDVIQTHTYAPNTITWEIQQTGISAAKDTSLNGVAHFNSSQFTDDQGFISLVGGGGHPAFAGIDVDTHTAPGTDPVVASGSGLIAVTGGQVAAGVVGTNVLRSDSLAANTITMEIQRSAAAASPTLADNGVCHFDSAQFSVDSSGYVQLATSTSGVTSVEVDAFTAPGTNPVLPDVMGQMRVEGSLGGAGTIPVQTVSLAANTYAVEVQTSQQAPSTDADKNGLSHFYDGDFLVDGNGFVNLKNPNTPIDLKHYHTDVIDDFSPTITALYTKNFWCNGSYQGLTNIDNHPGYYSNLFSGVGAVDAWFWLGNGVGSTETNDRPAAGFALAPNGITQIDIIQQFGNNPFSWSHSVDMWSFGYQAQIPYFGGSPLPGGNRYVCFSAVFNGVTGTMDLYTKAGTTAGSLYANTGITFDQLWHKYTIKIDSAVPNTALFYYDDTLVATVVDANITGISTGLGVNITQPPGGAAPVVNIDLYRYQYTGYGSRY